MFDGESPEELHRSLSALQVKLIDLGSTQCDGRWMKRKFFQALLPFMKETMNSIKGDANFRKMTAHDILQEIVARKISEKNVDDALARARGIRAPNLALKAKVSLHEEASLMEEEEKNKWKSRGHEVFPCQTHGSRSKGIHEEVEVI
jgi:hypothetical protein